MSSKHKLQSPIQMEKPRLTIIFSTALFLTILLWVYTASSKLIDLDVLKKQLDQQHFGTYFSAFLLYTVPLSEILAASLLCFKKTQFLGFCLSAGLMFVFTVYIGLVIFGFYDRVPCSCGGVLKQMGWRVHFWFNVFFLSITGFGAWASGKRLHTEEKDITTSWRRN